MNFELRETTLADRAVVDRLMELYLHDFSEFDGSDVDEHGLYRYYDLDYYWMEPARAALVVQVEGKWAGFVLTSDEIQLEGGERSVAEFFILRKYRRSGLGTRVAEALFERTLAQWEVGVHLSNAPACAFWRRMIANYTGGKFREVMFDNEDWHGPVFTFDNRRPASQP